MQKIKILISTFLVFNLMIADTIAQDWANLKKYEMANAELTPPAIDEDRIVFMGNSITEGWPILDPAFFANMSYVNRGISGQTTPQMLIRFRPDVIDLKPKVVVILAGTNDIAGNTGPMTLEEIAGNIYSMAELAQSNGIKVVLSSVHPVYDYPWKTGLEPAQKIIKLNAMIKSYAEKHGCIYLDYFSAMVDDRMGMKKEYADDEVHPTAAGYKVMGPLAEAAIAKAFGQD